MTLADEIIDGNISKVKDLLKDNPELNSFDEYGFTPLIESIIMRHPKITLLLLENNANSNFKDTTGRTPLHWAVEINNKDVCKNLLTANADPNQYSSNSQPILTYPLLRGQNRLIELLVQHGAKIDFAKAFINAKVLGHCFELSGETYIVSTTNKFILVNFEGFYLESSLNIIKGSLERFLNNFSAKNLRMYFKQVELIISAIANAAELSRLQHFIFKSKDRKNMVDQIFSKDLIILPGVYQGHAITFIFYKSFFAKCDRGANSKLEGTSVIYKITKEFDKSELFNEIVFQKNDDAFMHKGINELMGLEKVLTLPIPPQVTGNCSWANVEAIVPTTYFLLEYSQILNNSTEKIIEDSLVIFYKWREWNRDRVLNEFVQRFEKSPDSIRASLASVLGSVLINLVADDDRGNEQRIETIIYTLSEREYLYIINSYRKIFRDKYKTKIGECLEQYYKKYY